MKTEYIGFRVTPDVRATIDRLAQRRGLSITTVLQLAIQKLEREWAIEDAEFQRQLRETMAVSGD